jgi:hypothetical protein
MTVTWHTSMAEPPSNWTALVPGGRGFLTADYLAALESARPVRLQPRYATLGTGTVAAMQIVDVSVRECLPALLADAPELPGWQRWLRRTAMRALGDRRWRVLLCGNVFAGGEPGLAWSAATDPPGAFRQAAAAMATAGTGARAAVLVFKDVGAAALPAARRALLPLGYREVAADPVMVLPIRPEWRSFEDYLAALKARYRGHARRALADSACIERRPLSADDIREAAATVDALHAAVLARAAIRPSALDARGFAALRARLGDRFDVVGYYLGGRLVGFNTRLCFGSEMESYYFGLDYQVSRQYSLYRSMLYDDVAAAITQRVHTLSFGRTSQEVKSTLGAQPVALSWFGKSCTLLPTRLLAHLAGSVNGPFTAHDPFRLARSADRL